MVKEKKAILVERATYFSIKEHCEDLGDDECVPGDYNYDYGVRVRYGDNANLVIQLPDSSQPVGVGDLIVIQFVETDVDEDGVWELC